MNSKLVRMPPVDTYSATDNNKLQLFDDRGGLICDIQYYISKNVLIVDEVIFDTKDDIVDCKDYILDSMLSVTDDWNGINDIDYQPIVDHSDSLLDVP